MLLAGRRLWHRFRGQPDRADLDRPTHPAPGPRTRATTRSTIGSIKSTGYEPRPRQAAPQHHLPQPPRRPRIPGSPPTGPLPPVPAGIDRRRPELSDAALVSRSWAMAFATLVSRLTGFARIVRAGRDPGRRAVQRVLGGQSAAEPGGGARAGGDVHRDLRAGAGPRRAGRPRRRRGVRAAPGHVDDHAAGVGDRAVGARRAAAGAADAGPRPAGQRAADHRLRLPAAPPGARLRPHVGVHGDPEHPQRVRADGVGAGGQQRRRARDPGGVCGRPR